MTTIYTTLAKFGQFVVPFAFALGALISAVNLFRQKKVYNNVAKRSGIAPLNEMSWQDFERLVCEYYRRKGFQELEKVGMAPMEASI